MPHPVHAPTRQRGAGLIEVLVAVLVMSIGLLGVAAMQAVTLRNTQGAASRSQAVMHAHTMLDLLRANREAAIIGQYDMGWTCDVPAPAPDSRIVSDAVQWLGGLQQALGDDSCGRITCRADSCTVAVRWNDARATGGLDKQELPVSSRL